MRTLILDQYAQQSRLKRFFWNSLTGCSWLFWVYLWLPLLGAIYIVLSGHSEKATASSDSILALINTLAQHGYMVVTLISVFLIWSLIQALGKKSRHHSLIKHQVLFKDHLTQIKQTTHELPHGLKLSQNILVTHDEVSGHIQHIEAVDLDQTIDFKKVKVSNVVHFTQRNYAVSGASAD